MRGFIAILMLSILVLTACSPEPTPEPVEEVSCTPPFIKSGDGCCKDENNNYICDKEEEEEVEEEVVQEEVRIKSGDRWIATEDDLPRTVYMQRSSRILYTVDEVEYVIIVDKIDKFLLTLFHEQNRFKIEPDRTIPIGPLIVKYEGTDPPTGGNHAIMTITPAN